MKIKVNNTFEIVLKHNCYKFKTYKLDGLYHIDIFRQGLRGQFVYERSSYHLESKKRLFEVVESWINFYNK